MGKDEKCFAQEKLINFIETFLQTLTTILSITLHKEWYLSLIIIKVIIIIIIIILKIWK